MYNEMDESTKWIDGIKEELSEVKKATEESKKDLIEAYKEINKVSEQVSDIFSGCSTVGREIILEMEKVKRNILKKLKGIKERNAKQENNIINIEDNASKAMSAIKVFHEKQRYDDVTGLFNNEYYKNKIDLLIREGKNFYLIFIDLDNFKPINDNFGHQNGDFVLKTFGSYLLQIFGEEKNLSFRKHGDEFAILSLDSPEQIEKKLKQLKKWLDMRSIKSVYEGKNIKIELSFSYGIASNIDGKNNPEKIYKIADRNMYKMKDSKKID